MLPHTRMKELIKKENNSQETDVRDIGGDAKVHVTKIDKIEHVENLYVTSDLIKPKDYEDKDMIEWEKEERLISIKDMHMISGIIKKEEGIKKVVPTIEKYIEFFELLPETHKGHFINVIHTIIREDKAKNTILKSISANTSGKSITDGEAEEVLKIFDELQDEDLSHKHFSYEYQANYKKIYNLMRSDDIEEYVIPKIQELKKNYKDEKLKEQFLIYWIGRLERHPHSVFVSLQPNTILKLEIIQRLEDGINKFVKVYARKQEQIWRTRLVCNDVKKEIGIDFVEKEWQIGYDQAITFTFKK